MAFMAFLGPAIFVFSVPFAFAHGRAHFGASLRDRQVTRVVGDIEKPGSDEAV